MYWMWACRAEAFFAKAGVLRRSADQSSIASAPKEYTRRSTCLRLAAPKLLPKAGSPRRSVYRKRARRAEAFSEGGNSKKLLSGIAVVKLVKSLLLVAVHSSHIS